MLCKNPEEELVPTEFSNLNAKYVETEFQPDKPAIEQTRNGQTFAPVLDKDAKHGKIKVPSFATTQRKEITIVLDSNVLRYMQIATAMCPTEVGLYGFLTKTESRFTTRPVFEVRWPFIPEQEVNGSSVDATIRGMNQVMEFYREKSLAENSAGAEDAIEIIEDPNDVLSDIYARAGFWYHSHVNMGTTASKKDDDNVLTQISASKPFWVSPIGNKGGDLTWTVTSYWDGKIFKDTEVAWCTAVIDTPMTNQEIAIDVAKALRERVFQAVAKTTYVTYNQTRNYPGWPNNKTVTPTTVTYGALIMP